MKLSVTSPIWEKIFYSIREEFISDPDMSDEFYKKGFHKVYENEFSNRGITLVRSSVSNTLFWEYAEFPDKNYVEILLRWG